MAIRLFVVHGSHPCVAAARALELKGLPFSVVELPPATQPVVMTALFGARTVPGALFPGRERVHGSRAIMRRAEALAPDPPLWPADPGSRARVEEAEAWADAVLQPLVRRLLWTAFTHAPQALTGFQEGARLPPLPAGVVVRVAPALTWLERRLNGAGDATVPADLAALAGHLDRIDGWIADGVLGGDPVTAADLQVASSLRLLSTIGDVRPRLDGRPADALARRLFPDWAGDVPAGALPRVAA